MIHVRNIDMEKFSQTAQEIARDLLRTDSENNLLQTDFESLSEDPDSEEKARQLERTSRIVLRNELFRYIKRHKIVTKTILRYAPHLNLYEKRESDIDRPDVPKKLLDIDSLVPDFPKLIEILILEAKKQRTDKSKND